MLKSEDSTAEASILHVKITIYDIKEEKMQCDFDYILKGNNHNYKKILLFCS